MKCRECGAEMRVGREDWPHPDLPGVTLRGVEVRRCVNDPEHEDVALPHLADLHRTLAGALLRKKTLLTGPEIRFLRELCAWDVAQLAQKLGRSPKVLSQWEADRLGHASIADRLLRMLAAEVLKLPAPLDVLDHLGDTAPPSRLMLQFGPSSWRVVDESDPVSVWISFAEEDREAILNVLEVLVESLKDRRGSDRARRGKTSASGRRGQTSPATSGSVDHVDNALDALSAFEDPGMALQVVVDTLRALRPAPGPSEPPETHVEP